MGAAAAFAPAVVRDATSLFPAVALTPMVTLVRLAGRSSSRVKDGVADAVRVRVWARVACLNESKRDCVGK